MRLRSHYTIFARVHACALTRSESGSQVRNAERIFDSMRKVFEKTKNPKRQAAGAKGGRPPAEGIHHALAGLP